MKYPICVILLAYLAGPHLQSLLLYIMYVAVAVVCCIMFFYLYNQLTMGMCMDMVSMEGKIAIVTGGTSGVGLETARDFAKRGARVIIGADAGGVAVVEDIKRTTGNNDVEFVVMDFKSYESVRAFAKKIKERYLNIDILVNNAGIWIPTGEEDMSQINYLGHFLLTNLLVENLERAGQARVINVSSCLNVFGEIDLNHINYSNYATTKLMNILFTKELSRRWQSRGITSYSLHPGFVRTNIFNRHIMKNLIIFISYISGKSPFQGAQTSIYLSSEPGIENMSGQHFADCRVNWWTHVWTNREADNIWLARKLWESSEELVRMSSALADQEDLRTMCKEYVQNDIDVMILRTGQKLQRRLRRRLW